MLQIYAVLGVRVKVILQYNLLGSAYIYQHLFNIFCVVVAVFVMICGVFFGVVVVSVMLCFVDDFSAFVAVCSSYLSGWDS